MALAVAGRAAAAAAAGVAETRLAEAVPLPPKQAARAVQEPAAVLPLALAHQQHAQPAEAAPAAAALWGAAEAVAAPAVPLRLLLPALLAAQQPG